MNFRTLLLFPVLLALCATSAKSQTEGFALGAQLFSPTGITAKATLSKNAAITGLIGFNINEFNNTISLQTNLILNGNKDSFNIESGFLRSYYGIGVNFIFQENSDAGIGFRVPLGIQYELQDQPLEIYMDIAPTINIEPNSAFFLSSSMGFRYFL